MDSRRKSRRAWSAVLCFVLLVMAATIVPLGPPAGAQGEDSSLLDQLAALQARVVVLEDQLANQRTIGLTEEERCGLGIHQTLRDETVLDYKNTYGEWPRMDRLVIRFVEFAPDTDSIVIIYEEYLEDQWVMEQWIGCTFQEASDWWEE